MPLISRKKKQDLKKCIICQNSKDSKGDTKLISTEAGRNVIAEVSKSLEDDLLHGLRDADMINIKYHLSICMQIIERKRTIRIKEK